mmetsp:Transcript_25765/g.64714  ORF Transcript_25765/g.64714 Transcript_25765/m.64714 type:complete len:386 (-) Transcript_25765:1583-2740(-)
MNDAVGVTQECGTLLFGEGVVGTGAHANVAPVVHVAAHLEEVAAKMKHLLVCDLDDLVRAAQCADQLLALLGACHRLEAHHGHREAHKHHHVGVVDGTVLLIVGAEEDQTVAKAVGPLECDTPVAALRLGRVGDASHTIQNQHTGALQVVRYVRELPLREADAARVGLLQVADDVLTTFAPPRLGGHRIQHEHGLAELVSRVRTHPVVRKDGVGRALEPLGTVDQHTDTTRGEFAMQRTKLRQCTSLKLHHRVVHVTHEEVVQRRLFVAAETNRSHHHDGTRGLDMLRRSDCRNGRRWGRTAHGFSTDVEIGRREDTLNGRCRAQRRRAASAWHVHTTFALWIRTMTSLWCLGVKTISSLRSIALTVRVSILRGEQSTETNRRRW